ncbi:MAG: SpoIIE family protein phosphatase [Candidatus Cloacimonetes bacterium]|jgi:sigma-B regulation protein RsbU (phosphoserine phosphatase)|nr:SpoIIE family protein phosphatase [Candidatus Cloacimonadota bacterium]MDY0336286.1 SpoIIE family protein phosphatase [Candidatus Cloacimonadaceae bacterium]MCK9335741.1 SpoIIE family protein phosphatase [Candidatus Cloacimonadota bacterium]MDD2542834.1 SpoIIE family protein phosphatase [Candidatus Cloacimonadota bacterium]MDD2683384.1 SpoIIE family protein phosphatase [Candidatus Cloacimonadota bacterium]
MELDAKILIVDDDDVVINIIKNILRRDDYLTDFCHSGEEALQKVIENNFDLVLLDVHMGKGLDGYETCRLMNKAKPELPVILVTANQDDESVNRGFEAGSSDYIKKPVSKLELLARVNNTITLKRAERKNLHLIETLRKDLNTAANIQQAMLPKWVYLDNQILFSSYYQPCEAVGGDLFDRIMLSDTKYVVYIGDISGHGVQAALLMSAIKSTIKLMIEAYKDDKSMAELFTKLNERLYNDMFIRNNYLTLLMGVVDLDLQEFRFLTAGHPPLIRINKETGKITVMNKKGSLPLGWMPNTRYDEEEIDRVSLNPADMYLLFSDGIYECTNPENMQFGIDGLKALLQDEIHTDTCITLPFRIIDYLEKNHYETSSDDFTLFSFQTLKYSGANEDAQHLIKHHHIVLQSALKEVGKTAQDCERLVLDWTHDSFLAAKAELIVDEFLNNIITYGYNYQEDSEIVLEFRFFPEMLSIRFWDKGIEWVPENLSYSIVEPYDFELDGMDASGRGVKIIMSMSNRFQRRRFGHLNETKVEIDL